MRARKIMISMITDYKSNRTKSRFIGTNYNLVLIYFNQSRKAMRQIPSNNMSLKSKKVFDEKFKSLTILEKALENNQKKTEDDQSLYITDIANSGSNRRSIARTEKYNNYESGKKQILAK